MIYSIVHDFSLRAVDVATFDVKRVEMLSIADPIEFLLFNIQRQPVRHAKIFFNDDFAMTAVHVRTLDSRMF